MPVSRNRKDHKKKVYDRKQRIAKHKKMVEAMYQRVYEELSSKNQSVPEMLNKEDEATMGFMNSLTPEEQAEQDKLIGESSFVTADYEVIAESTKPEEPEDDGN